VERGTGHLGRIQECFQCMQRCNEEGQGPPETEAGKGCKKNKKGFKYINSKRKTRDNVGPLLNEVGVLVMEDAEKAELLNAFFASVFSAKAGPQESQALEVREEAYREDDLPLVEEDCMRDRLSNLDTHKSMGPDEMHPQVLRELADVIAEPLSIIFERSWRTGEVPKDWRKANVTPIFKKGKKEGKKGAQNWTQCSRWGLTRAV